MKHPGQPAEALRKGVSYMTPSTKRIIPKDRDRRDYATPTTAKVDYRSPADEAEARLDGPIGQSTDVELRAVAHFIAGPGRKAHVVYLDILDELRDRQREAERHAYRATAATIRDLPRLPRCPNTSNGEKRSRATQTFCRRAYRRWLENDAGEPVAEWLPCRSRTCQDCRAAIDQSDAERVAAGIGPNGWVVEIDAAQWATMSKRLNRRGINGARIPSNRHHDRVVVVADSPPVPGAVPVADVESLTADLMRTRPTGQARRLTTFGDIPSRDEWDERQRVAAPVGLTDWMAAHVQPADVEVVAVALGVEVEITAMTVRLLCRWDDWRADAVRRGKQWSDMRIETLIREGVIPADEPPDEAYEQAELVGVAS